jgi:hypothetical protein
MRIHKHVSIRICTNICIRIYSHINRINNKTDNVTDNNINDYINQMIYLSNLSANDAIISSDRNPYSSLRSGGSEIIITLKITKTMYKQYILFKFLFVF